MAPPPPRNPEVAKRRCEQILQAAIRHFARDGFPKTDLDAVAADLGCAKGTLYRYFPSKAELFSEAADFMMQQLAEALVPAEGLEPLDQIRAGIRAYLTFFDAHPEYIELIVQERAEFKDRQTPTYFRYREAIRGQWCGVVENAIATGQFRQLPADRVHDVIGNVLYGTIFTNHFAGRSQSLEEQADDVIDILFRGLLKPRGESVEGRNKDL